MSGRLFEGSLSFASFVAGDLQVAELGTEQHVVVNNTYIL